MSSEAIAIVDYGMGNVRSVQKALAHIAPNDTVFLTDKPQQILAADRVVFPGQGAMGACMAALNQHNLVEVIKTCAEEKPFLGICLGLQLLFEHSDENGGIAGLGIINGNVVKFPANSLKVPHMGWNNVSQTLPHQLWHKIENHSRFYSVHSYFVQTLDENVIAGSTNYGLDFTCAIAKNNIFAVQFHPEKSADDGLQLLTNFVNWQP